MINKAFETKRLLTNVYSSFFKSNSVGIDKIAHYLKNIENEANGSRQLADDELYEYIEILSYRDVLERRNADSEKRGLQSSGLHVERFDVHEKISAGDSTEARGSIYENKVNSAEKQRMLAKIRNCYFEAGVTSDADNYFEFLVEKYRSFDQPLKLLSDLANHNLDQEHVLEGILHILSNQDYDTINPIGITIVLACAVNQSPVIQDLLISCFESWDAEDGIDILEKLKLEKAWLCQYRDEVVAQLKSKKQSA